MRRTNANSASAYRAHSFDVIVDVNGRSQIDGRFEDRASAIERAEYLLSLAKFTAVRVAEIDIRTEAQTTIFERVYAGSGGKAISACIIDRAEPCNDLSAVFGFTSRRTIGRVLRKYLDDQVMLPAELLHRPYCLQGLQREHTILNQAINIVSAAQSRTSRRLSSHQADLLWKLFQQVLDHAKTGGGLEPLATVLVEEGVDGLMRRVAKTLPPEERARGVTFAIARLLEPARDWALKLEVFCDLLEDAQGQDGVSDLDELVAETLESPGAVRVLAGGAADLAGALGTLIAIARGLALEGDRPGTLPVVRRLGALTNTHPMPATREIILSRVAQAMDGLAPLTRGDRSTEARALGALTKSLCELGGVCGGPAMVSALVRRGKRALSRGIDDLPMDEAVDALINLLPDPVTRVTALLDLMGTEIGKSRVNVVLARIEREFASVRSVQDFFPRGAPTGEVAEITRRFGQKLHTGGIPKDLAQALTRRIQALTRQESAPPSPAPVQPPPQPAMHRPPAVPQDAAKGGSDAEEDETMMCDIRTIMAAAPAPKLVLTYQACTTVLDEGQMSLVLGRGTDADLSVSLRTASRKHATIHRSGRGFVLEDQSRNGTYLLLDGAEPILLQNIKQELTGPVGSIFLGTNWKDPALGREHMIQYRVVEP